jgi:acyl carrier protein
VSVIEDVKAILGQTLQLRAKVTRFDAHTALFGSMPEFDSMAVVTVVTALEERFGITVEDDEISADVFETIGSLSRFIEAKLARG